MEYRWTVARDDEDLVRRISKTVGVSPFIARFLVNRQIRDPETAAQFLDPKLKNLKDPSLLPQIGNAVTRIWKAILSQEPIVIFGDYDVDGVTSTAILKEIITELGGRVNTYLPDRMDEGYGLTMDAVENCVKNFNPKVLLAVDCGTTAVIEAEYLNQRGIDVIILDHHEPKTALPRCLSLINPKIHHDKSQLASECQLCSAGLAFKLSHALLKHGRDQGIASSLQVDLKRCLDLVALGTIADLMSLQNDNRILAKSGLEMLGATKRPGLVSLKTVAELPEKITAYHVGFGLGPRLNAAGRLTHAQVALELLLAPDLEKAIPLAKKLDEENRQRQEIEREIFEAARLQALELYNSNVDCGLVLADREWHIGVVGIVASRIVREFYRPTIILGGDGQSYRGSGRSIEGFDLKVALDECGDLLLRHGGHTMAAGVSCSFQNLSQFRQRFNDVARKQLDSSFMKPQWKIDADVELKDLTVDVVQSLEKLAPHGIGNPTPLLMASGLKLARSPQVLKEKHLRFLFEQNGCILHGIYWNSAHRLQEIEKCPAVDIAFEPQLNHYMGQISVQLVLKDFRASTPSDRHTVPANL